MPNLRVHCIKNKVTKKVLKECFATRAAAMRRRAVLNRRSKGNPYTIVQRMSR